MGRSRKRSPSPTSSSRKRTQNLPSFKNEAKAHRSDDDLDISADTILQRAMQRADVSEVDAKTMQIDMNQEINELMTKIRERRAVESKKFALQYCENLILSKRLAGNDLFENAVSMIKSARGIQNTINTAGNHEIIVDVVESSVLHVEEEKVEIEESEDVPAEDFDDLYGDIGEEINMMKSTEVVDDDVDDITDKALEDDDMEHDSLDLIRDIQVINYNIPQSLQVFIHHYKKCIDDFCLRIQPLPP